MNTLCINRGKKSHLYDLGKQALAAEGTTQRLTELEKIYLHIGQLLEEKKDKPIQEALEKAYQRDEEKVFNHIQATTLSLIHDITFELHGKTYNSVLLVFPHFVSTANINQSYPDYQDIEHIMREEFHNYDLIDYPEQFFLANIRLNCQMAEKFSFSDWYSLHKSILAQSVLSEGHTVYNYTQAPVIEFGQELNFFVTCLISEYDSNAKRHAPELENVEPHHVMLQKSLHAINERIETLNPHINWVVLPPSDYITALETGLVMQQDVLIDAVFQKYADKPHMEFALLPVQENNDLILAVWNPLTHKTEVVIPLHEYYQSEQLLIEDLLQKISLFDVRKTYLIEEGISVSELGEKDFDFNDIMSGREVLMLHKQPVLEPTLH